MHTDATYLAVGQRDVLLPFAQSKPQAADQLTGVAGKGRDAERYKEGWYARSLRHMPH